MSFMDSLSGLWNSYGQPAYNAVNKFFESGLGNATLGAGVGGLSLLGGLLGNIGSAEQAHRNRVLIRQMAKNRYQWTVDDLRKAGINPIYAVQGSSAPSVTGGPMPQVSDVITPAIGTALTSMRTLQGMKSAQSQIANTDAQTSLTTAQTAKQTIENEYLPDRIKTSLNESLARTAKTSVEVSEVDARIRQILSQVELNRLAADSSLPPRIQRMIKLLEAARGGKIASEIAALSGKVFAASNAKTVSESTHSLRRRDSINRKWQEARDRVEDWQSRAFYY